MSTLTNMECPSDCALALPHTHFVVVPPAPGAQKEGTGQRHPGCDYLAEIACNKCGWIDPAPPAAAPQEFDRVRKIVCAICDGPSCCDEDTPCAKGTCGVCERGVRDLLAESDRRVNAAVQAEREAVDNDIENGDGDIGYVRFGMRARAANDGRK
jgi:hypothetical protein